MHIVERPNRLRYSHSALDLYRSCPLKFAYRYVHAIEPRVPVGSHDLDYGKAMHDALAVLYSPKGTVGAAREAFAAAYPEEKYPAELPMWSQGKTFTAGIAAIGAYARHWADEDQYWEPLEIEVLEDADDQSETTRVVRLDLIVRDKRDGEIYGIDHKITGKYLRDYWKQFEPHSQIRMYADHIAKKYGHCAGFFINAVSFKHRSKAYTPRTGPDKGVQQPAGDWQDFGRICYNPNSDCLALEKANTAYWVYRIQQDMALGMFGYNTQECHRGGTVCDFWKLCAAGWTWPRDEDLITQHYRQLCFEILEEGRCLLDRDHDGEHSNEPPEPLPDTLYGNVVVPDEEFEEAEQ